MPAQVATVTSTGTPAVITLAAASTIIAITGAWSGGVTIQVSDNGTNYAQPAEVAGLRPLVGKALNLMVPAGWRIRVTATGDGPDTPNLRVAVE